MEILYILDRDLDIARRIRTILKLGVILLAFFTLTNCTQTPQQGRLRTLSAREFYPVALKIAQEWKSDAYLAGIQVDFLPEDEFKKQLSMSFSFESPNDDQQSLLIFFREDTDEPEVKIIHHPVPISVRNPITSEDWPVDSVKALAISQDNGGNEFLTKYDPEMAHLFLSLEERRPIVPEASLQWKASYSNLSTGEYVRVILDPQTGKVIEVEWQPSR
jgi:hypothetical protein